MIELGFRPLQYTDGYLPIEDHGLIGDGATAALIGRDGAVVWLCVPNFSSPALFCSLLDARRGGAFRVTVDGLIESRQQYEGETGVLVTELRSSTGLMRLTDALTLRSGADLSERVRAARGELLRQIRVLAGWVRLHVEVSPRGGAWAERRGSGLRVWCQAQPELGLQLFSSFPLEGLHGTVDLSTGDQAYLLLRWDTHAHRDLERPPDDLMKGTVEAWHRWAGKITYEGPQAHLVRRSAITLKLLDYMENGAIVAAPTSSLPEVIGGTRNWDYRYTWVRDAAFSVYALRRIGLAGEAKSFLEWVLDAIDRNGRPLVFYGLYGNEPPDEREDPELEGYRRSAPVRWGNAAAFQTQHDIYGEILDVAYQWGAAGGQIDPRLWNRLADLVETARRVWAKPDRGIWEVRSSGRVFTYSAALCSVALDRAARLAERLGLPGDVSEWWREAERIRSAILREAWDPEQGALTEHLGHGGLDASLLSLPLRRVLPADHPCMAATTAAIARGLDAGGGLLYRYRPEVSPDGLGSREGAFLLCSFWLVDNLAYQGRLEEAMDLYGSLCARANPLGLLPEQIDPTTGAFLGNYPQAFSHVGVISSGYNLGRITAERSQ